MTFNDAGSGYDCLSEDFLLVSFFSSFFFSSACFVVKTINNNRLNFETLQKQRKADSEWYRFISHLTLEANEFNVFLE